MSENLNGMVSIYSWSMPEESNYSLGKRPVKIVVVIMIIWLGFFCVSLLRCQDRVCQTDGYVDNDDIKVAVVCLFHISGLGMPPHRPLSQYSNQMNPSRPGSDTSSHGLILQQEPEFALVCLCVDGYLCCCFFFFIIMM